MLLPEFGVSADYEFSYAGRSDLEGRPALLVEVVNRRAEDEEPRIIWQGNNFSIFNIFPTSRVWIDPETYDVLRFDTETEPVSFSRFLIFGSIRFESRSTTRYATVVFDDTGQEFLVPQSYEHVRIIKGARRRPIVRTGQTFSNYRRFTGEVHITPLEGPN